jgi:hypothetical protein
MMPSMTGQPVAVSASDAAITVASEAGRCPVVDAATTTRQLVAVGSVAARERLIFADWMRGNP